VSGHVSSVGNDEDALLCLRLTMTSLLLGAALKFDGRNKFQVWAGLLRRHSPRP